MAVGSTSCPYRPGVYPECPEFQTDERVPETKWQLPDEYKRAASDIYDNMVRVAEDMLRQGVQALGSFIDVDPVIEDKAIQAAKRLKESHGSKLELRFINQVVKGVTDPEARKWFEIGAEFVDIIGGLPEKDAGCEAEHSDILFEAAKKLTTNRCMCISISTTRPISAIPLVDKTVEHGYQGRVAAVHCICRRAVARVPPVAV